MKKSLKYIQFYFRLALHKALKFPRTQVGLCLVIFGLFAYFAQDLTQSVSIGDQLDPDMASTQELNRLKRLFGEETTLGFIFEPKNNYFSLSDLCLIQNEVNEIIFAQPRITGFLSPYKIRQAVVTPTTRSYMRSLTAPCENVIQEQNKKLNTNPLAPLKNTFWTAIVTDHQAKDFGVTIQMKNLEKPGKFGTFDPVAVDAIIQTVQTKIPFTTWFTGASAQQLFMMKGMAQSQRLNVAVIFIILLCFRLLFGTWRSGAIFLFSLLFSSAVVFGSMGLLNYAVDPLTSCLFLLIAVSSLQDFIFISYDQMDNKKLSYKQSFRRLIVPSFFTSLTTMLGFGSLVVSELESIRRFGTLAAMGSFLEWVCVFLIVPSFMKVFPSWQAWVRPEKAWLYKESNRAVKKMPPRWLMQASLLVFFAAFFSVKNFHFSQTPSDVFPSNHPFQQGIEYIKKTRGWIADASLVFEPTISKQQKKDIISELQKESLIVKIESYDQIEDYMTEKIHSEDTLVKDLVTFELSHSRIAERYHTDTGESRVILYLQTTNTEKLNLLREKVNTLCPNKDCWLSGEYIGFADFSKALIQTLFDSLFMSLILVGFVIFYLTRATGKNNFMAVMVSALWGPAWMLVSIYLFDLSINFITCIVASTLVGLTGDNAIQYMFAGNHLNEGVENRGTGSIQCAFVMVLCSLTFLGSYFEPARMLGVLLAAGFVTSLFGDLWVLKTLIKNKN